MKGAKPFTKPSMSTEMGVICSWRIGGQTPFLGQASLEGDQTVAKHNALSGSCLAQLLLYSGLLDWKTPLRT